MTSILKKRTLADAKLDQIKIKSNILAAFVMKKVEKAAEAAEKAEKAAEATEEVKANQEDMAASESVRSEAARRKEEL